ncbi:MAG: hypothetical protein AAF492_22100, partial [Verrucomicrobiota bacterium]
PELGSGDSGGSHGGRGGNDQGSSVPTYGDYRMPVTLGTGGDFTIGGGRIKITANALRVEGEIVADGGSFLANSVGGGAGGSVWLDVGSLSGSGSIRADGGDVICCGGGGGGGRVAVYYDDASDFDLNTVDAQGGNSTSGITLDGAAGTVYLKDNAAAIGVLRIDNTQQGPGTMSTEIHTNLVEEIHVINAHVTFNRVVTSTLFIAENAIVDQNAAFSITNLQVDAQTWNQNTNLNVCNLSIENATWNQVAPIEAKSLAMTGGTFHHNTNLTVSTADFVVNGGTWNQNVDLNAFQLVLTNVTWNQVGMLDLATLTVDGGTVTVDGDLHVSNSVQFAGLNLIQNGELTLPTTDLVVDGWTYTLNRAETWNLLTVTNGGLITHLTEVDALDLTVNNMNIGAGSSVDLTGLGLPELGSGDSGGSHGGRGGNDQGSSVATYGDYQMPVTLGTGGDLTRGGGRIRITANTLHLDGPIVADGGSFLVNSVGGGAGG